MKKKLITLVLALVLCFAMCPAVHAASNGDLTVSTLVNGYMPVYFSNGSVEMQMSDLQMNTMYYCHAKLPDSTNFSSVTTYFSYTGTALKINGTQVSTNGNGGTKLYTASGNNAIDFTGIVTAEVIYSGGSKTYYVYAYPSEYYVKMSFEYENARAFSTLSGDTYGTSGLLDAVTSTQKATAAQAVAAMDTMCESMLPSVTAAQYKVLDNILIEPLSYDPESNNVYGLVGTFANARTNFTYTTNTSESVILSIGSLYYNSTGTVNGSGAGGWMYFVQRGNTTYLPLIGAQGFFLFPGDEVIWRYTCDYGFDVGYPMYVE